MPTPRRSGGEAGASPRLALAVTVLGWVNCSFRWSAAHWRIRSPGVGGDGDMPPSAARPWRGGASVGVTASWLPRDGADVSGGWPWPEGWSCRSLIFWRFCFTLDAAMETPRCIDRPAFAAESWVACSTCSTAPAPLSALAELVVLVVLAVSVKLSRGISAAELFPSRFRWASSFFSLPVMTRRARC